MANHEYSSRHARRLAEKLAHETLRTVGHFPSKIHPSTTTELTHFISEPTEGSDQQEIGANETGRIVLSSTSQNSSPDQNGSTKDLLGQWALSERVPLNSVSKLLRILKFNVSELSTLKIKIS